MAFKYIDRVGLEIEGGWNYNREDLIPEGSLYAEHFNNSACFGELITKEPIDNLEGVLAFLDKNWPTETQVKCGYHIHFSLKDINLYSACMTKGFMDGFVECMRKWAQDFPCRNPHFLRRLSGENNFCRHTFIPEKQVGITKKVHNNDTRYTLFNYCYGMFKTIECRLFPTFGEVRAAKAATVALIQYVEEFLEKNHSGDLCEKIEISSGTVYDDINRRVSLDQKKPRNSTLAGLNRTVMLNGGEILDAPTNTVRFNPNPQRYNYASVALAEPTLENLDENDEDNDEDNEDGDSNEDV